MNIISNKKTQKKLKGLFVCHVPASNIYGAATSFRLMLGALDNIDITVVVPRAINPLKAAQAEKQEKQCYKKTSQKVISWYLPWDSCYEGMSCNIIDQYSLSVRNALWKQSRAAFKNLVKKGNFDFVYLNSIVLNDMIDKQANYILHIREVLNNNEPKRLNQISEAAGLIFIDQRTKMSTGDLFLKTNHLVLNNIVDMKHLNNLPILKPAFFKKHKINGDKNTAVFSCIGTVSSIKGILFIIKSFVAIFATTNTTNTTNAVLLIIGKGENSLYAKQCKKLAGKTDKIVFLGEISNMDSVYLASDYVIRGDEDFRIGRTIFEGLYAGCNVIIPGDQSDIEKTDQFDGFSKNIFFYLPRASKSLTALLTKLKDKPVAKRVFNTNKNQYCTEFNEFIVSVLNETKKN